ncbi:MAG: DUF1667 domain-containing protein [Actinomycetota bacterium]
MREETITCITCPAGCRLKVSLEGRKIVRVEGNKCKEGIDFATEETLNPARILTTTIAVESKRAKRLAVRSRKPVPKDVVAEMVKEAKKIKAAAPVKMGDVLAKNLLGAGDIIASSSIEE